VSPAKLAVHVFFMKGEENSEKLEELLASKEAHWHEILRIQWVCEGDWNTKFFHTATQKRDRRKKIMAI